MDEHHLWSDWADHVPDGTHESIYYILSIPETWAGPALEAHPYSGLHFKIGRTKNVLRRLQNLQTGASSELIIHALEPGGLEQETKLHQKFKQDRRSGEWFSASPALTKHVFDVWKKYKILPPDHQIKVLQLSERISAYRQMRNSLGSTPDMVNPSLNEKWHGNVFIDLVNTKLLTKNEDNEY